MDSLIDGIVRRAQAANTENAGDYTGADGLLYCGTCHSPKETYIDFGGDRKTVPSACKCKQAEMERAKEAERKAQADKFRENCFTSQLQRSYRLTDVSKGKPREIAELYVRHWSEMKMNGDGLLFWGSVGTGKTFIAAAIVNALIDEGESARMRTAGEIVLEAQDSGNRIKYIDDLCSKGLLVIDDLGAERNTSYGSEIIHTVISKRCEGGKPLIVTTNIPLKAMKDSPEIRDNRVFDRVLGVCVPVHIEGESKRRTMGVDRTNRLRALLQSEAPDNGG